MEIGCGNGSNSARLQHRALRLVAVDGSPTAVELTRSRLGTRADAICACLPDGLPEGPFTAMVAAEVLYYLSPHELEALGTRLARAMVPGAALVLAHHHVPFADTATPPAEVHGRLHAALARAGRAPSPLRLVTRTSRWRVERCRLG